MIFAGFTEIFNKKISLHKEISDDNIRLVFGEYKKLYIIDASDIQDHQMNNNLFLYNISKTLWCDSFVKFYYYYNDYVIYPYIDIKSNEYMENEPIKFINKYNYFKDDNYKSSSLFVKLEKKDNEYYIIYYINNDIIDSVENNKRCNAIQLLTNLLIEQKKNELLNYNNNLLKEIIIKPADNINNELIEDVNEDINNDIHILNDNIKLYDYQKDDVKWMKKIEYNIDINNNLINYSYSSIYPVLNNKFLLYNYTLFPNITMRERCNNDISFTYYGGNLISDVGLGKTIIALYHIINCGLKRRSIYNKYVEFTDDCNYFYKRGIMKGKSCKKKSIIDKLYCKEHSTSVFIDKRKLNLKNIEDFKFEDFMVKCNGNMKINTNSTLVLCPNQLCDQWVGEYYSKFKNDKRILLIVTYDQYINITLSDILFSDIVIVSYNFLINKRYSDLHLKKSVDYVCNNFKEISGDVNKKIKILESKDFNVFHLFKWNRIILDEAHEIQNMLKTCILQRIIRSCYSDYKWNISGTPFANELAGFINLMNYNTNTDYLSEKRGTDILNDTNISTNDLIYSGFDKENNIVNKCKFLFKRNTKKSIEKEYCGNILIDHIELLEFTNQERAIYDSYLEGTKNKYSNFLIKLCCHPELNNDTKDLIKNCKTFNEIQDVILNWTKQQLTIEKVKVDNSKNDIDNYLYEIENNISRDEESINSLKHLLSISKRNYTNYKKNYDNLLRSWTYLDNSIKELNNNDNEISCPICYDTITKDIVITKCGHKFCWGCISEISKLNNNGAIKCPNCNLMMNKKDFYLYSNEKDIEKDFKNVELNNIIQNVKSTKIGNIIHFLKTNIKKGDKIILFSQWDELLHKVGNIILKYNIEPIYCNGTVYQRKKAISSFCNNENNSLIMLSSRNAASGINLTVANKIILLEPIYGNKEYRYSVESQAIGRADRIGQERPINIYRFIIKDTIEEDIINNFIEDSKIKQLSI